MPTPCFLIIPADGWVLHYEDGRMAVVSATTGTSGWRRASPRYQRLDTGEIFGGLEATPPGAMWDAEWYRDMAPDLHGADGRSIVVKLPNGQDWHIDGRASNCTSPCTTCGVPYTTHFPNARENRQADPKACNRYTDSVPAHRCWVRHGAPPALTVDKNGLTCKAGGGSIQSGAYHGHLVNGVLT